MNYRKALLLSPEDLGASGTKVINIDIDKPISRIDIKFKTTKVLEYMTAPGPANITKIELVDGSKPLHSLNGYENQALAYYSRGKIAMEHGQHIATLSEVDMYAIDFGRWLWDPTLAFLPQRFTNPQLKITYDEDVADTSVTVNECEVLASIFDEKEISPIGFLSALEHYDYTCGAADSYETISLPEDHPYRQILLRAYQDAYEPWYQIDEVRFDEGTLDRIPFDYTNLETYYRMMKGVWPMIQTPLAVNLTTSGRVIYVPQTDYWASLSLVGVSATNEAYINAASMRGGKADLIGSGNGQMIGEARGYLPWHTFQFPMGDLNDIDDWYQPAGKKPRLRMRASTGATSGKGEVVIEELYRY